MHLLRGSACVSVLTLLFACAATHTLAQGPSSGTALECPECDALAAKVAADVKLVQQRGEELDEARRLRTKFGKNYDEEVRRAEIRFMARQRDLTADKEELKNCLRRCAMRQPLPALPPEIPIVRHPVPATACQACESDAVAAKEALVNLMDEESKYLSLRSQAFNARAWLTTHPDLRDSPEYFQKFGTLLDILAELPDEERSIAYRKRRLDLAMDKLAKCNASPQCKNSSTAVPGEQPILGPSLTDEDPKAECDACDEDALNLKAQLALLRKLRAELDFHVARKAQLEGAKAKRRLTDTELAELQRLGWDSRIDPALIGQAVKKVEEARIALDLCNMKCPPKTTGPYLTPGSTLGPGIPGGGTSRPLLPGGPSDTGGTGAPGGTGTPGGTVTPGGTPSSGPQPPTPPTPPPQVIPPPPDATPVSTGAFAAAPVALRPFSFSLSGDAGLVTDQAPFIGVFPLTDSGLLRGSRRVDTASWHLGFDPPGWLWDLGGMDGHRTTSAQVPVGTESGWVYHVAAPNGSTGVSSAGGANASLRTKYEDLHLNLTLPSTLLKADADLNVLGEPTVGLRHAKITYSGMISNLSAPDISSATDQRVREDDLRAGYGIHVERTFPNRIVGSFGVGAEAIFYHAKYDGTQNNVCPVCSAATQVFNVSTSDDRNRLSLGVSSTAGLSYPVSGSASIFLIGMYRYEAGAPTLVNKITPTDAAPHLDKGSREFASAQLGFEIRF